MCREKPLECRVGGLAIQCIFVFLRMRLARFREARVRGTTVAPAGHRGQGWSGQPSRYAGKSRGENQPHVLLLRGEVERTRRQLCLWPELLGG